MFYAKEILSMQAKTDISLIYYVSTTKNNRRITKNEINKINIKDTLITALDQAFALRLYGFILRGVSKIYMLKMRYYENEVAGLLNLLKIRISKNKKDNFKSEHFKSDNLKSDDYNKIESCSSDESEDIYDGGLNNNVSLRSLNNKNVTSYNDLSIEDYNYECVVDDNIIKTSKVIIDDEIELNDDINIKRIKRSAVAYEPIEVREYPVLKLIQMKTSSKKDSVEIYRNRTSSNTPSGVMSEDSEFKGHSNYDSNINNYCGNLNDNNYGSNSISEIQSESIINDDNSSTKIKLMDLIGNESYFSTIVFWGRQNKAVMFYELLDLVSKNKVKVNQDNPESDIYITRIY